MQRFASREGLLLINRLLGPVYEAIDAKLRLLTLMPVEGPPLVKLETALVNLAREVSFYFAFREPIPLHLRQYAASSVSGDNASPGYKEGIRIVQRHDPRSLFLELRQHGRHELCSLDELGRLLMEAPPEWAFLLPPPVTDVPASDLKHLRDQAWENFAGEYVRDYLWLVGDPKRFDPETARVLFRRLVQRILLGRQRHHRITPLIGLWLGGQEVPLSRRVRLRPATDFERHLWLNPDDTLCAIPVRGLEVLRLSSVIEYEESPEEAKAVIGLFSLLRPKLGAAEAAVLASLRLLADPLQVAEELRPAFMERHSEGAIHETQQRVSLLGGRGAHWGGDLRLTADQRQRLQVLFERIHPLVDPEKSRTLAAEDRRLAGALHRWLLSFDRAEPKDWLIDCWVALEGLFTQRGESQLTEKCATRVSQELATLGAGSAPELYAEIRASYQHRCEVVHGERETDVDYGTAAGRLRRHLGLILRHRLR
jgi:hypothetical protein